MNFLFPDLTHSFRIGSYQGGINWIVGSVVYILFHTQTDVTMSPRRYGCYCIRLLCYWSGKFCMKTFSLNATKYATLILGYFVLCSLHSAFIEIMNYELIC